MARGRARIVLLLALAAALAAAVPGDAASTKAGRSRGVPVLVTFLADSHASVDVGAGFRQVPLTGYALGYVPRARVDRSTDVPIVLLRAEAFPQATDLILDTACDELSSAARLDPATTIRLARGGGGAELHPGGGVTAKARMALRLRLDLRAPDGCDQPLVPAASATTVAGFGLTGRASGSSGLGRVTMTAPARSYVLRACLAPGPGARCAKPGGQGPHQDRAAPRGAHRGGRGRRPLVLPALSAAGPQRGPGRSRGQCRPTEESQRPSSTGVRVKRVIVR
jgi:hypothetical protein